MSDHHLLPPMFATLDEYGFLLNNLFKLESGVWRCHIRRSAKEEDRYDSVELATGATAAEAMRLALDKMIAQHPKKPTLAEMFDDGDA